VKSIFVIAVNQPPHANPIISVCFPRAAVALADISIIEYAYVYARHLEIYNKHFKSLCNITLRNATAVSQ